MENEVRFLYLDDIIPNRFQPRENFDEQALKELAVSIKEHGVIQPIVVRQIGDKYEIIAGERRYKASTMAGLTKIPAIIKNLDDKESSKVALIENLQRKDLTPIEEARTYQKILELDALTQEELARTMGKSQSAVSNKLRLLALTDEVQDALLHEQISERHARSLLNVTDKQKQVELLNKVINSRMTVRELDQEIKQINGETIETDNVVEQNTTYNENADQSPLNNTETDVEVSKENMNTNSMNQVNSENKDLSNLQTRPFNIDNLLTSVEQSNKDINSNDSGIEILDTEYKDDVIGGSGLLAGMTLDSSLLNKNNQTSNEEQPKPQTKDSLYQNFDEKAIDEEDNKERDNSINLNKEIGLNSSEVSIKTVKEAITNIKDKNQNIEMEEFDFDDFYQIVIRIDKK